MEKSKAVPMQRPQAVTMEEFSQLMDYCKDKGKERTDIQPAFCISNRTEVIDKTLALKDIFKGMQIRRASDKISLSDNRYILCIKDFQE